MGLVMKLVSQSNVSAYLHQPHQGLANTQRMADMLKQPLHDTLEKQ